MMARVKLENRYSKKFEIEKENGEVYRSWYTGSWKIYDEKGLAEFLANVDSVKGNTYEMRGFLKQLGFNWNPKEKAWQKISKEEADQAWREKKLEEEKELLETMAKTFGDMETFEQYWNKRKNKYKYLTEDKAREIWNVTKEGIKNG